MFVFETKFDHHCIYAMIAFSISFLNSHVSNKTFYNSHLLFIFSRSCNQSDVVILDASCSSKLKKKREKKEKRKRILSLAYTWQ